MTTTLFLRDGPDKKPFLLLLPTLSWDLSALWRSPPNFTHATHEIFLRDGISLGKNVSVYHAMHGGPCCNGTAVMFSIQHCHRGEGEYYARHAGPVLRSLWRQPRRPRRGNLQDMCTSKTEDDATSFPEKGTSSSYFLPSYAERGGGISAGSRESCFPQVAGNLCSAFDATILSGGPRPADEKCLLWDDETASASLHNSPLDKLRHSVFSLSRRNSCWCRQSRVLVPGKRGLAP